MAFLNDTYRYSSVDTIMLDARIKRIALFERRGSDLYLDAFHVQIIIQQNILGAVKFE